jgi:hypothetical protein
VFEQELYEKFEYIIARPYFHIFEGQKQVQVHNFFFCVWRVTRVLQGLSFADEEEANTFHAAVTGVSSESANTSKSASKPPVPAREKSSR